MATDTKALLDRVASWPPEDQDELAECAAEIEARRAGGVYQLTDEERAAVRRGMDAARRSDFVPDDEMEAFYRLHHKA
jgi:hypothetical protein